MTVVSANHTLDVGNGYPLTATGTDVLFGGTMLVFPARRPPIPR